eukprot:7050-Pelagococcus_subviridis.AAC.8
MKHREVRRVDGVAAVDVAGDEKFPRAVLQHLRLVRARVAPQHGVLVHVVRVVRAARHVVGGHEHGVEVRVRGDDGVHVVERRELAFAELLVEVVADDSLDDAEGMVRALVERVPHLLEDVVRHVVVRVARDDVCGVGAREGEVGMAA